MIGVARSQTLCGASNAVLAKGLDPVSVSRLFTLCMATAALVVLLVAGRTVLNDAADYRANTRAIDAERALEASLLTMERLALERGPTFWLLTQKTEEASARRALEAARAALTIAIADLRQRLSVLDDSEDTPDMARVSTLAAAVDALDAARLADDRAVDEGLSMAPTERDAALAPSYAARAFSLKQRFVPLLNALQTRVARGAPQAAPIVQIARYAADLRELAGLQASSVTAAIAEGRPFTLQELQTAERTQGEIDRLLTQIDAAIEYVGSPSTLVDAQRMARAGYFARGRAVIDPTLASGATDGRYAVKPAEFIRIVTAQLPSLVALRDAANMAAIREATQSRDVASHRVVASGIVLLVVFVTVAGLAIGFRWRVVLPLLSLTGKVDQLASGNRDIEIGLTDRRDEVGGLARAMEVFRSALIETERLRAEQSRAQEVERQRYVELQDSYRLLEAQREELATMAAALATARDAAEEASRSKSAFVASISHEIRTPLHGIIGIADLLLRSGLDAPQRVRAEMLKESGKSLVAIVDDILDVSKLEAGRITIEAIDFVPSDEIAQVVDLMRPKAAEKGLTLLPTIDERACRRRSGDPTRFRQVLLNFVGNAIKFTDWGTVSIVAHCADRDDGGTLLRIDVVDTGIGISMEAQQRLFMKFTQADQSIARRFGGTGLGLAIAKELVEAMHGQVGVESHPGVGSRFWFTLPLEAPAERRKPALTPSKPTPPTLPGPRSDKRILLAEDVRINQIIATDLLTSAGYAVDVAQDGAEAVEAARSGNFDLILMDVHLPRIDGLEAARQIRMLDGPASRLPIIALTADAVAGRREEYLAAGMSDFLSKPFDFATLMAIVERWIADPRSDIAPFAAPDITVAEVPVIEERQLTTIQKALPAAKFRAFLVGVIDAIRVQDDRISALAADARFPELAREAHDLISTAGNAGMGRVVLLARRLESACADGRRDDAVALVAQIKSEIIPVCLELEHRYLAA